MNINLKKFMKSIRIWPFFLACMISIWNPTVVIGGIKEPEGSLFAHEIDRSVEILKILSVLEYKVGDQKLLEKAKDKLFTLSDGQTRLIAFLSDRIANENRTTGAEIAFLLITALIVFS